VPGIKYNIGPSLTVLSTYFHLICCGIGIAVPR